MQYSQISMYQKNRSQVIPVSGPSPIWWGSPGQHLGVPHPPPRQRRGTPPGQRQPPDRTGVPLRDQLRCVSYGHDLRRTFFLRRCNDMDHNFNLLFFKKFLQDTSPFCGATDTPVFGFWWRLPLSFKARVDSLICVLPHLHTTDSSDSPLVQHLLTSWHDSQSHFLHAIM